MNTAENINIIGAFWGVRDVEELTEEALYRKYNIHQADVMALFGGTILCGGDVMAEAMRENVAKTYIIVGGFGHTTSTLQETMKALFPDVDAYNMQEAELFNIYLNRKFGLSAEYLETASTNCGNNIPPRKTRTSNPVRKARVTERVQRVFPTFIILKSR